MAGSTDIERASKVFNVFADRECKAVSKLYYQLALEVADDSELLELALHRRARQPIPNLFFGAIHYLLLQSPEENLADFYPSISRKIVSEIPFDLFRTFCIRNRAKIIEILQERIVQTNAINRTAYLMPIVSAKFKGEKPLNVIDIGTSSGLTMNMDLYQYDYLEHGGFGKSTVLIKSAISAGKLPTFDRIKKINRKIGIDQNPLDIREERQANWLKALIWPDQVERFNRLEAAIELANASSFELKKATSIVEFQQIIDQLPKEEDLLIYHTHVLYQFTKEERKAFRELMDKMGRERSLGYLAVEGTMVFDRPDTGERSVRIEMIDYQEGNKTEYLIGRTNGHANWIKWEE